MKRPLGKKNRTRLSYCYCGLNPPPANAWLRLSVFDFLWLYAYLMRITSKAVVIMKRAVVTNAARTNKKAVNLSVSVDLLAQARALHVNLSQLLEEAMLCHIKEQQKRSWLLENKDAVDAYNEHIKKNTTFSDKLRMF